SGELLAHDSLDSEPIEHARIELQASAPGHWSLEGGTPVYRVSPGAAQFLVVGRAADEWVTLPLPNSSEIVASVDEQGHWSFAPFEIAYRDDLDQPWTLRVQASRWTNY
ncbi:MAG: hypothetical protein KC457_13995, partial [Myxococcales bacterium]|nr:hypothetical protein [Myxococcales bacterium]